MKTKQLLAAAAAAALFLLTGVTGVRTAQQSRETMVQRTREAEELLSSILYEEEDIELPEEDFLACIDVVGTIQASSYNPFESMAGQYDHTLYMDFVDTLMDCPENKGILLYMDSPGGTVYESDELYLKLMEYKEATSRPIYAYFASEACSGAYYIAMAADEIYASRNAWTGSIGVIISLMNYKGLMDTLGIQEIDITTGANKAMGSYAADMTEEQRAIFQSMVDEAYDQFVGIVAQGRNLPVETVRALGDGRIYSARQALDNGMIDHIAGEQDAIAEIMEKAGLDESAELYAPERQEVLGFLGSLVRGAASLREKSSLELFRELERDGRNGVLMYAAG